MKQTKKYLKEVGLDLNSLDYKNEVNKIVKKVNSFLKKDRQWPSCETYGDIEKNIGKRTLNKALKDFNYNELDIYLFPFYTISGKLEIVSIINIIMIDPNRYFDH